MLNRAFELRQHRFELLPVDARIIAGGDFAFGVVGIGAFTDFDDRLIGFGVTHNVFAQTGRRAQTQHQDTRRGGVERSGVTDLFFTRAFTHDLHNIMTGISGGFIDIEQSENG